MESETEATNRAMAARAVEVLNRALAADRKAIEKLFDYRVGCNQELADDPTIQVRVPLPWVSVKSKATVSVLGLINGICGVDENSWGYVGALYEVVCPTHGPQDGKSVGDVCNHVEQITRAVRSVPCSRDMALGHIVEFKLS